jgi:tRNA A58 N-methylase Trm61
VGFFAHPQVIDHLADWDIPEDQVQNYNDALEAGRSVVTYKATASEAAGVEQTFKDAGLKNVKTFES